MKLTSFFKILILLSIACSYLVNASTEGNVNEINVTLEKQSFNDN